MQRFWLPALLCVIPAPAFSAVLSVPAQYTTIQAALDAAQDGDEVVVADGVYTGAGNGGLYFGGKAILVRSQSGPSNCTLDFLGASEGLSFVGAESPMTIVEGFTLRNASGNGGAVFCHQSSSPTLRDCWLIENVGPFGGAVFCDGTSAPRFVRCIFAGNSSGDGGSVHITAQASPSFLSCLFVGSSATSRGGAIFSGTTGPTVLIEGCTFAGNSAAVSGGAIHILSAGSMEIRNSILWADSSPTGNEIALQASAVGIPHVTIEYSDVEGGAPAIAGGGTPTLSWGPGALNTDPLFVDPDGVDGDPTTWFDNDYHLQPASPCVDAGDPSFVSLLNLLDIDSEPRVQCSGVDMGSDEASTCPGEFRRGDCNDDSAINIVDAVYLLGVLFPGVVAIPAPTCLSACDVNLDDALNLVDVIDVLNSLFGGGPVLPLSCSPPIAAGALGCQHFVNCP